MKNLLNEMVVIADYLDQIGMLKEASDMDDIMTKVAGGNNPKAQGNQSSGGNYGQKYNTPAPAPRHKQPVPQNQQTVATPQNQQQIAEFQKKQQIAEFNRQKQMAGLQGQKQNVKPVGKV